MTLLNRLKANLSNLGISTATLIFIAQSLYRMPNTIENEASESVLNGIRLFYIKQFFTGQGIDNFFDSLLGGTHGGVSFIIWVIYTAILHLLGLPLNEFWYYTCQTITMALGVLLISLAIRWVYKSPFVQFSFVIFCFLLFKSSSLYYFPYLLFYQGLLLIALVQYHKTHTSLSKNCLIFMLCFNGMSLNLMFFPVAFWLAFSLEAEGGTSFLKNLKDFFRKNVWIYAGPSLFSFASLYLIHNHFNFGGYNLYKYIKRGGHLEAAHHLEISGIAQNGLRGLHETWISFSSGVFTPEINLAIVAMYALGVFYLISQRKKSSLYLFPLFYFIFYIVIASLSTQARLFFIWIPLALMIALGLHYFLFGSSQTSDSASYRIQIFVAVLMAGLYYQHITTALNRPHVQPNLLKSVGYVLREEMSPQDQIASLLSETDNLKNEYYYGKTFYESPLYGKEIWSLENLEKRGLLLSHVFPFYVISQEDYKKTQAYKNVIDELILKLPIHKIADIIQDKEIRMTIYSSRPLPYQAIDAAQSNQLWDQKYAHLPQIFSHHHVGIAEQIGQYF